MSEFEDQNWPDIEASRQLVELRRAIHWQAGDEKSLLGVNADATAMILHHLADLALALNNAQSLAEVRSAAAPLADLLGPMLARIETGETKLPYLIKGEAPDCLRDVESRCTAVSNVLEGL